MSAKWLNEFPNAETIYQQIEKIFVEVGYPIYRTDGILIPNMNFLTALLQLVISNSFQHSAQPVQAECDAVNTTSYGPYNVESFMRMLSLIPLLWLQRNINSKTRKGHCRSSKHTSSPTNCQHGYKFHKELYLDLRNLFDKLLKELNSSRPTMCSVCSMVFDNEMECAKHVEEKHKPNKHTFS